MRRLSWIAVPILTAVGLGAAGTLYAASAPTAGALPFGTAFWSAVAGKVGVSATKLEAAVQAELKADGGAFHRGGAGGGEGEYHGAYGGAGGSTATADAAAVGQFVFQTAAKYAGLTPAAVAADVAKGQSLDAIVAAHHKSASGLASAEDKALLQVLKAK